MTTATTNTPARQVNYNAPPGDRSTLNAMLGGIQSMMADVLPQHLTPERMVKLVLTATNRTPKILNCTGSSIMESVMRASELGLDCSGTLGEAYLVPYKSTCQLIIGYRGLAKLARQSGEVKRMEAEIVYSADYFDYRKGSEFVLDFRPNYTEDRGEVVGAYALVEFKDGGIQAEFMTVSDIERIRAMSKGRNAGPWTDHWNEQARKTVFRRLSKWLPLSSEKFDLAIQTMDQDVTLVPAQHAAIASAATDDLNAALEIGTDATPAPEVVAEQSSEDIKPRWLQIAGSLAMKCSVSETAAEERIAEFAGKVFKSDPSDLTEEQLNDIQSKVDSGDLAVG